MNNIPIHVLLNFYAKDIDDWMRKIETELKQPRHIGNSDFGFNKDDFEL